MKSLVIAICLLSGLVVTAQDKRWQQRANYSMDINMDVESNRFSGKQKLTYTNNSPDTLKRIFYHLYFNAFQPNSSMDVRSRELGKNLVNGRPDWDPRVKDRIAKLKPDEIGYQKVSSLKMNGQEQAVAVHETIMEVRLTKPILPKTSVVLDMVFEAQVPLQVRRNGRDNPNNGVRYSMSQWYPKLCEYDEMGWHPDPYVAREFYGVWGDYTVNISIDKNYKLAGTGVLLNAAEIGWGYDVPGSALKQTPAAKRTWKFSGKNIHDFVWAADPDYKHLVRKIPNGPVIHVVYNDKPGDPANDSAWTKMADAAVAVFPFVEQQFGKYPYPQYSFIQGGDGGMEYAMATLLNGPSLGTAFHELMHSWYQMVLGFNESLYPWMDEGFTNYAEELVAKYYYKRNGLQDYRDKLASNPANAYLKEMTEILPEMHAGSYENYYGLVASGIEEPLTTHADHYNTNFAYSLASYSKGAIFLEQLGYIVGAEMRDEILKSFYNKYKFTHPTADDFIRYAQLKSGIQLNWYKEYWVNSTKTIDYSIDSVWSEGEGSAIRLRKIGQMPMPVDVKVTYKDSSVEWHYIPLNLMFAEKAKEAGVASRKVWEAWKWTHPTYQIALSKKPEEIAMIEIDPTKRMADVKRKNNVWIEK